MGRVLYSSLNSSSGISMNIATVIYDLNQNSSGFWVLSRVIYVASNQKSALRPNTLIVYKDYGGKWRFFMKSKNKLLFNGIEFMKTISLATNESIGTSGYCSKL